MNCNGDARRDRLSGGQEPERQEQRYPLQMPIKLATSTWGVFLKFYSNNISRGGLFVSAASAPPRGTQVLVEVFPPDGLSPFSISGTVVHVIPPDRAQMERIKAGFGIQFEQPSLDTIEIIDELVNCAASTLADALLVAGKGEQVTG